MHVRVRALQLRCNLINIAPKRMRIKARHNTTSKYLWLRTARISHGKLSESNQNKSHVIEMLTLIDHGAMGITAGTNLPPRAHEVISQKTETLINQSISRTMPA